MPIIIFQPFTSQHSAVPEQNPHPPQGRSLEIPGGGGGEGVLNIKILEAKYEAKLEFPGRGCKAKNGYFLGLWI